jgi:succinate-semialdehyde dehydrogenase/glutarate-semialdehyde dehydrogenase
MQTRNLVNGAWVSARSGAELDVTDPATDDLVARVPSVGVEETRAAIDAASAALPAWREAPALERAHVLRKLSDLMLERREALAELVTREQGKPLAEARTEIAYAASFVEWAAEEAKRVYGEIIPSSHRDRRILVLRRAVGVTACITPWNFPAAMITRKLGPALATGCTMIVKPAIQTPLTALALAELAVEAGVPSGVMNVVTGDAALIAGELLSNPVVRKLSFTGSTEVGRILMARAANNLTRLSLELGGHAPFIVFGDADLDAAVRGAIASKFRNAGQTCIASNRFLVHEDVRQDFVARMKTALESLKIGSGRDEGVEIGPLIDDAALEKVERHVADARDKGARLITGGERVAPRSGLTRRFYRPTLLDGVNERMLLDVEETFGPVVPVRTFRDDEEAIAIANASPYGLAAYFYTRDAARVFRVAERLDYGVIGANDGAPSTAQAPFGGMKASGFGREGGHHVMHEYVDVKYVSVGV